MSVDAADRFLVTGGHDKTIRVWALPQAAQSGVAAKSLEPLDVLRPPAGEGKIGNIYAVAISPDGKLIAAGGSKGNRAIDVFDRGLGKIVAHLSVPEATLALAFSPDGHTLVAGLGSGGLSAWQKDGENWRAIRGDSKYSDSIYGLSFAKDGRLAAASFDGSIRLYDRDLKLLATVKAAESAKPAGIAFSPDGKMLAVGYDDSSAVVLLDGQTLELKRTLQEPGKIAAAGEESNQNLSSVTWSMNGRFVFAGGSLRYADGNHPIRRWAVRDGTVRDLDTLGNTNLVQALAPYGANGVLVVGSDPFVGAYDGDGRAVFRRGPVNHDMRTWLDNRDDTAFRVSDDGDAIEMPGINQPTLRFGLSERRVSAVTQPDDALGPPHTTTTAFVVTHWFNETQPMFRKADDQSPHPLKLEPYETSRSLAIARSGKRFVLGTAWYLRLYNADGAQLWKTAVSHTAWRVNITPDEKLIVAAFGDGTVRWYRIDDGTELLALFVREADHEWVAWTPSGYYDASENGHDLIGWHLNRGADKSALFYSASRFRATYYRPDLVRTVLRARRVPQVPAKDLDAIISHLPPIVRVIDVNEDSNGRAVVRYLVESPTGEPVTVIPRMDGEIAGGGKGVPELNRPQTVVLQVPADSDPKTKIHKISLSASSGDRTSDTVTRDFAPLLTPQGGSLTGDLYALVIGVRKFSDPHIPGLLFADQDADAIATVLKKQEGLRYRKVYLTVLRDEQATRANIAEALARLTDNPKDGDVSMLYLSGHGVRRQSARGAETQEYYFLPFDTDFTNDHVASSAVGYDLIEKYIKNVRGNKIVFLDTCHAGTMGEQDPMGMVSLLGMAEGGAIVWASSTGAEESIELPKYKHGAFTVALLEVFHGAPGAPRTEKGRFTQNQVTTWLETRLPKLTNGQQHLSKRDFTAVSIEVAAVVPP